jgi:predicted RNA-binding protein YlqC (UPF0109 family)
MEDLTEIANAVATLIKLMVDRPDKVHVGWVPSDAGNSLRISVDPTDIGKVIGKQGRTARSLRLLVSAMGMSAKKKITLDIVE